MPALTRDEARDLVSKIALEIIHRYPWPTRDEGGLNEQGITMLCAVANVLENQAHRAGYERKLDMVGLHVEAYLLMQQVDPATNGVQWLTRVFGGKAGE